MKAAASPPLVVELTAVWTFRRIWSGMSKKTIIIDMSISALTLFSALATSM